MAMSRSRQYLPSLSALVVSAALVALAFFAAEPSPARALGAGNAMCAGCQMDPTKPMFCPTVFCVDSGPGGTATGMCASPGVCKTTGVSGYGGGQGILDAALQGLQQLLQQLMQKQGGGGGGEGGSGASGNPSQLYPNCVKSQLTDALVSVPCVDSTGAVITSSNSSSTLTLSGSLGSDTNSLLNALSGTGAAGSLSTIATQNDPLITLVNNPSATQGSTSVSTAPRPPAPVYSPPDVNLPPGSQVFVSGGSGDVVVRNGVATVVARIEEGTAASGGFFGGSPATNLCQSRPWTAFPTGIIAPAFFDSLCVWRGYSVGQ